MAGADLKKLQLAVVIFEGMTALDAIGPYEVLQALPNIEVVFVSHKPGLYRDTIGNLSLEATQSFEEVSNPDIVLVPGGFGTVPLLKDHVLLNWLVKVHETSLYTTSVCSGSTLLAAAGLLTGLKAASHWGSADMLENYGAIYTQARVVQEGRIVTAAGVSSGIDMGLTLAAMISDESTAKAVQLCMEYDPQPPFDAGSLSKAGPEIAAISAQLVGRIAGRAQAIFKFDLPQDLLEMLSPTPASA